jgi:hypothetical protein
VNDIQGDDRGILRKATKAGKIGYVASMATFAGFLLATFIKPIYEMSRTSDMPGWKWPLATGVLTFISAVVGAKIFDITNRNKLNETLKEADEMLKESEE